MTTPTTRREVALGAAFARLQTIADAALIARLPTFEVHRDRMPAVVMLDGADEVFRQEVGVILIQTGFVVVVLVKAESAEAVGPTLNDWHGRVVAALGADQTLGGAASAVLYEGCESASVPDKEGSGPLAGIGLRFVIDRWEYEGDPYRAAP